MFILFSLVLYGEIRISIPLVINILVLGEEMYYIFMSQLEESQFALVKRSILLFMPWFS